MSERDPEIVAPGQGRRRESGEFVSQPAKLLRIASMIRELLQDVRQSSVDEAGRKRLRGIYDRAMGELKEGLSEDLQHELGTLTIPLEGPRASRKSESPRPSWSDGWKDCSRGFRRPCGRNTCRRGLSSMRCVVEDCHRAPLSSSPATATRVSISRARRGPSATRRSATPRHRSPRRD